MTRTLLTAALVAALASGGAFAAGSHSGGHETDKAAMALGQPGGTPDRIVEIIMKETDDGEMIFEPGDLAFTAGETVRLQIRNAGDNEHEFVMDTPSSIQEHKDVMERFPEMEHDEPNAVRLLPGESAEILWTFGDTGTYEYACLLFGHYEAGMHGPLIIN
jgi:uncharacterized cupredoxin-like copper-binding protein